MSAFPFKMRKRLISRLTYTPLSGLLQCTVQMRHRFVQVMFCKCLRVVHGQGRYERDDHLAYVYVAVGFEIQDLLCRIEKRITHELAPHPRTSHKLGARRQTTKYNKTKKQKNVPYHHAIIALGTSTNFRV